MTLAYFDCFAGAGGDMVVGALLEASGATPSRSVPSYWAGDVLWIMPTDMTALAGDHIRRGEDSLAPKGLASCGATLLPLGSVAVTTRATLGLAAVVDCELATNQGFKSVVPHKGRYSIFLCYLFRKLGPEMVRRDSGTTFLEISGTQFGQINFAAPKPGSGEQERTAVAIGLQQQRIEAELRYLKKIKAIKKGLMKDLLSGHVRVPAEVAG